MHYSAGEDVRQGIWNTFVNADKQEHHDNGPSGLGDIPELSHWMVDNPAAYTGTAGDQRDVAAILGADCIADNWSDFRGDVNLPNHPAGIAYSYG